MDTPSPASGSGPLHLLLAIMLAAALWLTTRGWEQPILDRHEFRQLQTATSAYWLREAGWKLDYETPLFGPPWSIPMEFPVYQTVVAKVSAWTGLRLESAGRGVSLFFFLATLPAVYGLTGLLPLARSRRLLVVAAVLASPTYLFYARTLMIETTALCFSVWFLWATVRAVQRLDWRWAALAAGCGALAALAKVTTFLVYCPPAAALCAWLWWRDRAATPGWQPRRLALAAAPAAAAIAVGLWWVRHADAVKHSNPLSGFLTSTELAKWNWGTLEQRLSGRFWTELWNNVSNFVLGEFALAALIVAIALTSGILRRFALAGAGFFLLGTLLFSNLFFFHDYYYCANALLLLMAAGVALAAAWDDPRLPAAARGALLALFFGGQLLTYHQGYADYLRRELPQPPALAEVIREIVPADGVLLINGWDWNALVPYYAQRRALMIPHGREDHLAVLEDLVTQLPPRRIAAFVVQTDQLRQSPSFIRWRAERFNLSPAPFASSAQGDLYLAEDLAADAARKLAGRTFPGVELNLTAAEAPFAADTPVDAAMLALPIFTPAPAGGRTKFGMNAGELDGSPVLHSHAPSELEFNPPAGARAITARFGLLPGAYAGGPAVTDGIGVEIFERLPDGRRRTLLRRQLDPARRAEDRGTQLVELTDIGPFRGTLVFRLTTGPDTNVVNDWAYWAGIEIR